MSGFFRRPLAALALAVGAALSGGEFGNRHRVAALLEQGFGNSLRDAARRRKRKAKIKRYGASKYTPHQGFKELAKWRRRYRTWHQPRGNGDQYAYTSLGQAMEALLKSEQQAEWA